MAAALYYNGQQIKRQGKWLLAMSALVIILIIGLPFATVGTIGRIVTDWLRWVTHKLGQWAVQ